jgi:hypothetical protein
MTDQSYEDAITSLAALSRIYGKLARQRDEARAIIARVEALCDNSEAFGDELEVGYVRAALEPTK